MFSKDDLCLISSSVYETKKVYITQLNELYTKSKGKDSNLSDEDKKYKEFLQHEKSRFSEIEQIIDLEVNTTNYFKLIKRAFRKMLLKKCIKWLSD